jgi:hypothetical protein
MEREFRSDWQWNSSTNSSTFTRVGRVAKKNRIAQKIMPCINEDFSSTLDKGAREEKEVDYPPKIITTDYRKNRSYKSRKSRRNSTDHTYESADSCEKGDMLETVRSIGSLGSAPTLVDSKEIDWKSFGEPGSPTTLGSPRDYTRRVSSPTLSPISPLAPCLLRDRKDSRDDDEIYPFP